MHDGQIFLDNGPIKNTKLTIHRVTGYPTLGQPNIMCYELKHNIEKDTCVMWIKRGLNINTIVDLLVPFSVRVIAHKFCQSSRPNSMPCIVVNLGYKLVKKNHEYDLAKMQLQQLIESLQSVRKNKISSCKFSSLLICILFYV